MFFSRLNNQSLKQNVNKKLKKTLPLREYDCLKPSIADKANSSSTNKELFAIVCYPYSILNSILGRSDLSTGRGKYAAS
jgi:hypothetical protein